MNKSTDLRVLVVGSGAREHALVRALFLSDSVEDVFVAPGNAGMDNVATCVDIQPRDTARLMQFAREADIDLTVVGGEELLVEGIADAFDAAGLTLFGPSSAAARLEGSKQSARRFMADHDIPTATSHAYSSPAAVLTDIARQDPPFVLKMSGLAAGKGVRVVRTDLEKNAALRWLAHMEPETIVLCEQYLTGNELSVMVLANGTDWCWLGEARDAKCAFDGNAGPMTGGMGAYSPVLLDDVDLRSRIGAIVDRTLQGLVQERRPYRGFLYLGLMLTDEGPMVLEYNCRLGDPEAQVILPRLCTDVGETLFQTDVAELLLDVYHGCVPKEVPLAPVYAVGVVLASEGYPGTPVVNRPVHGLDDVQDAYVYTGGIRREGTHLVTSGGRICTVVGMDERQVTARIKAYTGIGLLEVPGAHYRTDIGTF